MEFLKALFKFVWRLLKAFHVIAGSIVLVFILALILAGLSDRTPPSVPSGAALVIAPSGPIVEVAEPGSPLDQISIGGTPTPPPETSVHDIVRALRAAASDDRVPMVLLLPDGITGISPAASHYLASELRAFRESGKPIVAYGDFYSQSSYLLAAQATEVYLNPYGEVALRGYGVYPLHFADALEKLKASVNVFRVGTYKSAVEPLLRNDMSAEVKEENREFLGGLWQQYAAALEEARGLEAGTIDRFVDSLPEMLASAGGNTATLAEQSGLVDGLMSRAAMRDLMMERVGRSSDSFRQVQLATYLSEQDLRLPKSSAGNQIAVIFARGTIVAGSGDATVTAAETVIRQIRDARIDRRTKAIVLRLDTPGGSAYASELIRQEIAAARAQGLPVIASMGGIAASGGYWIAAEADRILVEPSTITGSIGVFLFAPTFEKGLAELGIQADGVGTSDLAGGFGISRALTDPARRLLQIGVESDYDRFLTLVSEGRDMTRAEADAVAQGRVWLGTTAIENGLADDLGTLDDAIDAAAQAAGIDQYDTRPFLPQADPFDQFLSDVLRRAAWTGLVPDMQTATASLDGLSRGGLRGQLDREMAGFLRQINVLSSLSDPRGVYALCLTCNVR